MAYLWSRTWNSRKNSMTQASAPQALDAGQQWARQPVMLGEGTDSYPENPLGGSGDSFWGVKRFEEEEA